MMNTLWSFNVNIGLETFHVVLRYVEHPVDAFEMFVSGWDFFPKHMNDIVIKIIQEANRDGHNIILYKSDFQDWKEIVDTLEKIDYTISHSARKIVPSYVKFVKEMK